MTVWWRQMCCTTPVSANRRPALATAAAAAAAGNSGRSIAGTTACSCTVACARVGYDTGCIILLLRLPALPLAHADVVPVLVSLLVRLLQPMEPPDASGAAGGARMAYIATLRRNPATLQLFLDTVAEAGLHAAVVDGWGDPGVSSAGGRPQSAVRFHLGVLDDVSVADRIVIHRITH